MRLIYALVKDERVMCGRTLRFSRPPLLLAAGRLEAVVGPVPPILISPSRSHCCVLTSEVLTVLPGLREAFPNGLPSNR